MKALAHHTTPILWGVLLLALAVSGCRTYGDYGAHEATLGKIQHAAQLSAEALDRAQGERDALARAATANPNLSPLAERYAAIVEQQEAMVATHQALAEEAAGRAGNNPLFAWVGPDSYRWLHRTYGALVGDHQVMADRYDEVLRDLQRATGLAMAKPLPLPVVAPHFYAPNHHAGPPSVADILSQAQAMSAADDAPVEEVAQ